MNSDHAKLRERRLLHLFMLLNGALVAAFLVFLVLSRQSTPDEGSTTVAERAANPPPLRSPVTVGSPASPTAPVVPPTNSPPPGLPSAEDSAGAAALATQRAVPSPRQFTWQDLETPEYARYIHNLRAVGCPADKVRQIVLADINQLFDQRRLRAAVAADIQWWRPQPEYVFTNPLRDAGRLLAEQRRSLITHLLGVEALAGEEDRPAPWSHVPLTGAVLGAMPLEKHARVQAICGQALERQEEVLRAPLDSGPAASPIEAARSRDQTRVELREALTAEELEEFLLRYSQVARSLRLELAVADPTEAEFRKVFRAMDPIEHAMQRDFGGVQTMSQQQRERHERQRDTAIKEALGAERYQTYQFSKDALFPVAQALAQQYQAPSEALLPVFRLIKTNELRRQAITGNANLTQEQKRDAINAVNLEQVESIQKLVGGAGTARRY